MDIEQMVYRKVVSRQVQALVQKRVCALSMSDNLIIPDFVIAQFVKTLALSLAKRFGQPTGE